MAMRCMSEEPSSMACLPFRSLSASMPRVLESSSPQPDHHGSEEKSPCMQSSPVSPAQGPCQPCPCTHTGTAHPVHCGLAPPAKRRRLLRAETLEEDFPVIDLALPRFFGSFNRREIVAKIP